MGRRSTKQTVGANDAVLSLALRVEVAVVEAQWVDMDSTMRLLDEAMMPS